MSSTVAQMTRTHATISGRSFPLGATPTAIGVNFSLFSRHATQIELLFFDHEDDTRVSRVIQLAQPRHRTYHYWHVEVPGVQAGQLYAYRVTGPFDTAKGHRFDSNRILLDPYGRGVVVPKGYDRHAEIKQQGTVATAMKSVVVDPHTYDWEGDNPLRQPSSQTIIYEMHVGGFTRHPSSGVSEDLKGTYAGLIQKIPYLQDLGITAVELLPVFQFDPQDAPSGLVNYWGYAPVSFFAPHQGYSFRQDSLGPIDEFRDMVKALHRSGIEVILDVVYNHTAEGNEDGPTLCYRGIDNLSYYILEEDRRRYANYSGTGNTIKAHHPIVRRMILDSLCYWVEQMHIDGFRFDLASVLARDHVGVPMANPPLLWDIESDPRLAGTKLIAEAWDAAGLFQVGSFIGDAWKEWNGHFRDDIRDFFRCKPGSVRRLADRILGSPEIYGHEQREAEQSVNFITCHDGFTVNDLVSYEQKHNEANREGNRDGGNDNRSWNCGIEGPSGQPEIEKLRNKQVKNFLATTLLSVGLPMILMGDEVRRTQLGNNNAYCHNNELSWFNWSLLEKHADLHRFVKLLIQRRLLRSVSPELNRKSLNALLKEAKPVWHGIKLYQPDWGDHSHSLALTLATVDNSMLFHVIFNAYWEPLRFELPSLFSAEAHWCRWIDTNLDSPNDISEWNKAPVVEEGSYVAAPRSLVVLTA